MNLKDYLLLFVVASPFVCGAIGYGLEGSWQGVLLGAGSGMLLGGVLRRIIWKFTELPEDNDNLPTSDSAAPSQSKTNKNS